MLKSLGKDLLIGKLTDKAEEKKEENLTANVAYNSLSVFEIISSFSLFAWLGLILSVVVGVLFLSLVYTVTSSITLTIIAIPIYTYLIYRLGKFLIKRAVKTVIKETKTTARLVNEKIKKDGNTK